MAHLKALGLQPETQEGYPELKWGGMDKPVNILAKIEGSGDGRPCSSFRITTVPLVPSLGASDAGSGWWPSWNVYGPIWPRALGQNDIIILFTDGKKWAWTAPRNCLYANTLGPKRGARPQFLKPAAVVAPATWLWNQPRQKTSSGFHRCPSWIPCGLLPHVQHLQNVAQRHRLDRATGRRRHRRPLFCLHRRPLWLPHRQRHGGKPRPEHATKAVTSCLYWPILPTPTCPKYAAEWTMYVNMPFIKMIHYPFSWVMCMAW